MKCKECGQEIPQKKTLVEIKECKIEVQGEYDMKDVLITNIKIPKGFRLLTLSEWLICYNKYRSEFVDLNKDSDEIVEQPLDELKEEYPYWNVWFRCLGGRSGLDGDGRGLCYDLRVRGVRFCRDLK